MIYKEDIQDKIKDLKNDINKINNEMNIDKEI